MLTTFIFIAQINEQGYPCLVLDEHGQIVQELLTRDFISIKTLQADSKTIVVLSCQQFSLHDVELSLLSDKKARAALPYALEENLAQPIEELHLSFDRRHHQKGHYLVAVCDRTYFLSLITQLGDHELHYDLITLDWFALKPGESAVFTETVLLNQTAFQGALDWSIAQKYLQPTDNPDSIRYVFQGQTNEVANATVCEMSALVWIARRLLEQECMNLCQGAFQQKKHATLIKQWYLLAAALFVTWLVSVFSINAYTLYQDNQQIKTIDTKIAVIYREFFPGATQIVSPRFRITQFLKSNENSNDAALWIVLNKFTKIVYPSTATIQEINWQNHLLLVTLSVHDFNALDTLQNSLKQAGLTVKQTQASKQDDLVVSTLELTL